MNADRSHHTTDRTGGPNGSDQDPIPGPAVGVDRALPEDDASLADLLSRLIGDVSLLLRQEIELAKTELRRDLTTAGKASGMLVAGGLLAFVALLLLAWAAAWGLATVLPVWAGFLVVALVVGGAAAAAIATGRKRIRSVDLTPHQSIASIKRDKDVLSERTPR
jgi:hypothetical protein